MSRGRLFGTLCSMAFLVNLGRIGFAPLLEPLMTTFAVGPGTAGLVASLVWLGTAAVRIPVGYLLTRLTRRTVILVGGSLLATAFLARLAGGVPERRTGGVDRNLRSAVRSQWRVTGTGVALLGTGFFVWSGVFNFYVSFLAAEKGFTTGAAGTALTVAFAAGVPAFWVAGRLADRYRPLGLLVGILLAFSGLLVGLTMASGTAGVLVASAAIGFAVHGAFPAVDTYMLSTLPDDHRGSGYAIYSGLFMAVSAGGPWLVGTVTEAGLAYTRVFQGLAGGLAVVVLAMGVLYLAGRTTGSPAR